MGLSEERARHLTVPEISDRYYTMEIVDFMADNFAYVGTRATGTKAGNYAIFGPDWKGALPPGVMRCRRQRRHGRQSSAEPL